MASVGKGQGLPHARHIQFKLALKWTATRTAEPINKAESLSVQMSVWKSRTHRTGRGKREKKWNSEKHQKEHQAERMKRMFFMMEWRSLQKGPVHKPTLEQSVLQPKEALCWCMEIVWEKRSSRENATSWPWPPALPVAALKLLNITCDNSKVGGEMSVVKLNMERRKGVSQVSTYFFSFLLFNNTPTGTKLFR